MKANGEEGEGKWVRWGQKMGKMGSAMNLTFFLKVSWPPICRKDRHVEKTCTRCFLVCQGPEHDAYIQDLASYL